MSPLPAQLIGEIFIDWGPQIFEDTELRQLDLDGRVTYVAVKQDLKLLWPATNLHRVFSVMMHPGLLLYETNGPNQKTTMKKPTAKTI